MNHNLKVDIFTIMLQGLLLAINVSFRKMICTRLCLTDFDHNNLKALEICVLNLICVGFRIKVLSTEFFIFSPANVCQIYVLFNIFLLSDLFMLQHMKVAVLIAPCD